MQFAPDAAGFFARVAVIVVYSISCVSFVRLVIFRLSFMVPCWKKKKKEKEKTVRLAEIVPHAKQTNRANSGVVL